MHPACRKRLFEPSVEDAKSDYQIWEPASQMQNDKRQKVMKLLYPEPSDDPIWQFHFHFWKKLPLELRVKIAEEVPEWFEWSCTGRRIWKPDGSIRKVDCPEKLRDRHNIRPRPSYHHVPHAERVRASVTGFGGLAQCDACHKADESLLGMLLEAELCPDMVDPAEDVTYLNM